MNADPNLEHGDLGVGGCKVSYTSSMSPEDRKKEYDRVYGKRIAILKMCECDAERPDPGRTQLRGFADPIKARVIGRDPRGWLLKPDREFRTPWEVKTEYWFKAPGYQDGAEPSPFYMVIGGDFFWKLGPKLKEIFPTYITLLILGSTALGGGTEHARLKGWDFVAIFMCVVGAILACIAGHKRKE